MRAFFLPVGRGKRFCVMHTPDAAMRGALLYVHPFAEELNRTRRMAALQARAFARAGWTVLQMDLFGCGDSPGDFGEADWQRWIDDIAEASAWLQRETGRAPALWALRAGCLLATQAARSMPSAPRMVLWQPALSGKRHLQQFLRLNIGTHIVRQPGRIHAGTQLLRDLLTRGETIEVVGYALAPAMAWGLEAAELQPPVEPAQIAWLEVQGAQDPQLAAASTTSVQRWEEAGHSVHARTVRGPAFWQTPEITECPALIEATLAAVNSWPR
jgi:exosortase A-associated hydrolase 2